MKTLVSLHGTVCVYVTHFCSHTLFRMCICISTFIYVHLTAHVHAAPPMHSLIETWVPLFGIVCLSQSPYFWSHTLVGVYMHQYMYLCPPDSQYHLKPLHTVTWKHGCPCVALWVSLTHFCSHTFIRICICISICIYVHLTPHISLNPFI